MLLFLYAVDSVGVALPGGPEMANHMLCCDGIYLTV